MVSSMLAQRLRYLQQNHHFVIYSSQFQLVQSKSGTDRVHGMSHSKYIPLSIGDRT
jgi:hypothetical protein